MAKVNFSFEVFPPKKFDKDGNPTKIETIYKTLDELKELNPDFISVTYGAGGSENCENTLAIVKRIQDVCNVPAVAHLTCINLTKDEAKDVLTRFKVAGIKNILALRGDKVEGRQATKDFVHATDLIKYIKEFDSQFKVYAACYPEKHIDALSMQSDVEYLKAKQDLGASVLLSQLFFDNDKFYAFRDITQKVGVDIPIEAGIMCATNCASIKRMVGITGATLPQKFLTMMEHFSDNKNAMMDAGINYAIDQITDLIANGVQGIHLYTMNNSYIAKRVTQAVQSLLQLRVTK